MQYDVSTTTATKQRLRGTHAGLQNTRTLDGHKVTKAHTHTHPTATRTHTHTPPHLKPERVVSYVVHEELLYGGGVSDDGGPSPHDVSAQGPALPHTVRTLPQRLVAVLVPCDQHVPVRGARMFTQVIIHRCGGEWEATRRPGNRKMTTGHTQPHGDAPMHITGHKSRRRFAKQQQ